MIKNNTCVGESDKEMKIVLTHKNSGDTIDISPETEVEIRLEENRTTGYQWTIENSGEKVISIVDEEHIVPEKPRIGQGGIYVLRFRVNQTGEDKLSLKYWQSWEGESSVERRFNINVIASE